MPETINHAVHIISIKIVLSSYYYITIIITIIIVVVVVVVITGCFQCARFRYEAVEDILEERELLH